MSGRLRRNSAAQRVKFISGVGQVMDTTANDPQGDNATTVAPE
jgi:hypothetical protein